MTHVSPLQADGIRSDFHLNSVARTSGDLADVDANGAGAPAVVACRLGTRHLFSDFHRLHAECQSSRRKSGIATGAANFFRALFSALVVALLGAIVLRRLGGVTGMSVEMLARTASAPELAYAFRFVFLACGLILSFGIAFLISMEERPLKGPTAPSQAVTAPTAPRPSSCRVIGSHTKSPGATPGALSRRTEMSPTEFRRRLT